METSEGGDCRMLDDSLLVCRARAVQRSQPLSRVAVVTCRRCTVLCNTRLDHYSASLDSPRRTLGPSRCTLPRKHTTFRRGRCAPSHARPPQRKTKDDMIDLFINGALGVRIVVASPHLRVASLS